MSTEKITLNVSAIDLANIDLLVENGFSSNRSELMKTAIKQYLNNLESETKELISSEQTLAKKNKQHWVFGGHRLSESLIKEHLNDNIIVSYVIYGILVVDKNISLSQIKECVKDIKVYGVIKASKEIKDFIKNNN